MKKKKKKICYFCGKEATQGEHIPPKAIIDKNRKYTPVVVPSCPVHNSELSKDDEYFRWFTLSAAADDSLIKTYQFKKMMRQMKRKPKLFINIARHSVIKEVHTKGGIYLGKVPIFEFDRDRVQKSVERLTRGFYFSHKGLQLSPETEVSNFNFYLEESRNGIFELIKKNLNYLQLTNEIIEAIQSLPINIIQEDVFEYRFYIDKENTSSSIWFYMIYNRLLLTMVTGTFKQIDS